MTDTVVEGPPTIKEMRIAKGLLERSIRDSVIAFQDRYGVTVGEVIRVRHQRLRKLTEAGEFDGHMEVTEVMVTVHLG